jgi:hypothetical protein
MGFPSLQHIRIRRSTCSRVLPARFVPPSGFGYPLDGFLPSDPCRSYFVPAALLGFPLRSVPLLKGGRTFPPDRTHLPFRSAFFPTPGRAGPLSRGWGFSPSKSPWQPDALLTHRLLDTPLGFPPSRVYKRKPCPGFCQDSFHALSQV